MCNCHCESHVLVVRMFGTPLLDVDETFWSHCQKKICHHFEVKWDSLIFSPTQSSRETRNNFNETKEVLDSCAIFYNQKSLDSQYTAQTKELHST